MMGLVLVVSMLTQLLAERLRVPAILPLLVIGIMLGPEVLGLVDPGQLGTGLRILIPLMVAIIVFEGGMVLDLLYLRQVSPIVRNLITIGCAVTFLLASLAAWLLAGLPFSLALLFGSLVSVTGPTVINPLMRRAAVTQRLKTILMAEGVLIDAVGVVLSVIVLESLLVGFDPLHGISEWVVRVIGGSLLGLIGGWLLGRSLRTIGRSFTAELTRLSALAGALAIYTLGEAISPEMGIAAAATAGIVVGNMRYPHAEAVHHLKGDLTTIGIGVIFILLAARLRFADLLSLGWGGLAVVLVMMLIIRPASVYLSTLRSPLRRRERRFLAAVGPRGIVAASFATFAALRLEEAGYAGSQALVGLVFLVIIGTVTVQSFSTPWIARLLGVQPMLTMIIGADPLGRGLAKHLEREGEEVILVDRDPESAAQARQEGLPVIEGDATREEVLRKAGITRAHALVATTSSDKANLLICQMARLRFNLIDVVSRVNDEGNVRTFADLGIRAMSPNAAAVMVLENLLRRPSTMQLLADIQSDKDVRELIVHNPRMVGTALKNLQLEGDALIIMIRRNGALFVPHGSTTLMANDILTIVGARDAMEKIVAQLQG